MLPLPEGFEKVGKPPCEGCRRARFCADDPEFGVKPKACQAWVVWVVTGRCVAPNSRVVSWAPLRIEPTDQIETSEELFLAGVNA